MNQINLFGALFEGFVSFFSPCILPLLPVYFGYLSGVNQPEQFSRKRTIFHTLMFVLGISFAYVLLALAMSSLGNLLTRYQTTIQILAGVTIILFGLVQLGIIDIPFLNKQGRLVEKANVKEMNAFAAFLLGFLFSFTWMPCVGPTLTSILLLASTNPLGYMYILVYLVGFVVPFLVLGVFTTSLLQWFLKNPHIVEGLKKVGAVILIVMGVYTLYQGTRGINAVSPMANTPEASVEEETIDMNDYDFQLLDVNGKNHTLSDYKGKTIVLNYFTTWCQYCHAQIESFKRLHEEMDDVVFIGILETTDETEQEIQDFISENEIPYLVLIDSGSSLGKSWGVSGYPTSFFITDDFEMAGYLPGYVEDDTMKEIVLDVIEEGKES